MITAQIKGIVQYTFSHLQLLKGEGAAALCISEKRVFRFIKANK